MLTDNDDFDFISPILTSSTATTVKKSNIKNDSFNLINFNDSLTSNNNNNNSNSNVNENENENENNNKNSSNNSNLIMQEHEQDTNDDLDDLLEVSNGINDCEEFWLCEPKKPTKIIIGNNSNNKENEDLIIKQQQQQQQQQHKTEDVNTTTTTTTGTTINPYKWIMDEVESNKNLDKAKRSLLVTLDDISKGLVRRSRSVSSTRNPLLNYHTTTNGNHNFNNLSKLEQSFVDDNNNQSGIENDIKLNEEIKKLTAEINNNFDLQSKSNESFKIPPSTDNNNVDSKVTQSRNLTNYGLTFKKKKPQYLVKQETSLQQKQEEQPENVSPIQQYDDLTDVQVIAKMQEDSLRQSVINLNKSKSLCGSINNLSLYDQNSCNISSSIDLNNDSSSINNTYQTPNTKHNSNNNHNDTRKLTSTKAINKTLDNNSRSDSISSEQSLNSNSADSPINSNLNVNAFFWDDDFMPLNAQIPDDNDYLLNININNNNNNNKNENISLTPQNNESSEQIRLKLASLAGNETNLTTKLQTLANGVNSTSTDNKVIKHQSRLPTPRSSRESNESRIATRQQNGGNNSIKASTSNTSISSAASSGTGGGGGTRRPPIPNGSVNLTQKKSTSLVRGGLDTTALQLQQVVTSNRTTHKIENLTPRISSITSTRSTSNSAKQQQQIFATPVLQQQTKKKASLPNEFLSTQVNSQTRARLISPSGLLTDGPSNRISSVSPARRSVSPGAVKTNTITKKPNVSASAQVQKSQQLKVNDKNNSLIPSPSVLRKQQQTGVRRSFLPQPTTGVLARPSNSPGRHHE